MSKWCHTCYRNEVTGVWKSCNDDCPVFGKYTAELANILISITEILKEADGVASGQEFGLSYGQAINYLDEIKEVVKT